MRLVDRDYYGNMGEQENDIFQLGDPEPIADPTRRCMAEEDEELDEDDELDLDEDEEDEDEDYDEDEE